MIEFLKLFAHLTQWYCKSQFHRLFVLPVQRNHVRAFTVLIRISAWELRGDMEETAKYFVVRQKAVPEVLLKVVEAKRLLESERVLTVQEAVDAVGISRSSFYKYKDDIFEFHDSARGTTITLTFQMDDEPGLLSDVLKIIAEYRANILTIHQSIPINGIASLSLSIQILQTTGDISRMVMQLEEQKGVRHVKILAKE